MKDISYVLLGFKVLFTTKSHLSREATTSLLKGGMSQISFQDAVIEKRVQRRERVKWEWAAMEGGVWELV